jgi:hypothetical protein
MTDANDGNAENEPKILWQNQPSEEMKMTLNMIHEKAQKLRARNRREFFGNIATIPLAIGISWFGFLHTHDMAYRSIFVVAVVWAVLGQYLVHRGMSSVTPPLERLAAMNGLEFYRREISWRRNLLGRFLQWTLGPVVLCIGALILLLTGMAINVGKPGAALPFTTLAVIWLIAVFVLRSRHQRELRQEIDQLNEIERMSK